MENKNRFGLIEIVGHLTSTCLSFSLSLFLFALLPSIPVRNGSGHEYIQDLGGPIIVIVSSKKERRKERKSARQCQCQRENVS